jgi:serine/threonine protein kinase
MEMDPEKRRTRVKEIADRIAETPDPERLRSALAHCGQDNDLLMDVLDYFGNDPTISDDVAEFFRRDPIVSQRIGSYRIHWRLGSGGNGDVYLATRTKEPHQQVAIKLLRLYGDENEEFRRRFQRERQIIALLRHPYIVRLFDADRTRDGRPYFVMEYIPGEALDKYANARKLAVHERLQLFRKICDAVQYLHTHLIVHRDLKPANILVDTDGVPKILDFGIAKLLRPEMMDGELITVSRRQPLTAQYASPEQWEGGLITSASDVYSLGVILFQLLTGQLPIPWKDSSFHEYQRRVCEGNLPQASKSVFASHGALCREPSDATLALRLRGDLDAILAKAMSRDVIDRYATVAAFAEDIERHLKFLPVQARRDGLSYRAQRFVRRNRALAASFFTVWLALSLGLGTALVERNKAQREEALALQERNLAQAETRRANELARQSEQVAKELQGALEKQGAQDQQLRAAVANQISQLREVIRKDENPSGSRGEEILSKVTRKMVLGRNYAVLGQLLTLSGDRTGARSAFQSCIVNLEEARERGDLSTATLDILRTCQAGPTRQGTF